MEHGRKTRKHRVQKERKTDREREKGKKEKKRRGELSVQLRSVSRVHLNRIEGSAYERRVMIHRD